MHTHRNLMFIGTDDDTRFGDGAFILARGIHTVYCLQMRRKGSPTYAYALQGE